jgi:cytoskeleton protein RodZ
MSDMPETKEATTPGELLKQARERAGLSVERVAKDLYLDVHFIQAIEINNFKDLGAPVYAKGYLRRYAKLVGVAEDGILLGYQQMGGTPVSDPIPAAMGTVPQSRKPLPRWVWWCVTGLLVLAGLMTLLNLRSTDTEDVQQGALISQPLNTPGSSAADSRAY